MQTIHDIILCLHFSFYFCLDGIETKKVHLQKYFLRNELSTEEPPFHYSIKETSQSDAYLDSLDRSVFKDESLEQESYNYGTNDHFLDKSRTELFPFKEYSDEPNYADFIEEDPFPNNPLPSGFSDDEDDEGLVLIIPLETSSDIIKESTLLKTENPSSEMIKSFSLTKSNASDEADESKLNSSHKNTRYPENVVPALNSNSVTDEFISIVPFKETNQEHGDTSTPAISDSSALESTSVATLKNSYSKIKVVYQLVSKNSIYSHNYDYFTSSTTTKNTNTLENKVSSNHSDDFTSTTTMKEIGSNKKDSAFQMDTNVSRNTEVSMSASPHTSELIMNASTPDQQANITSSSNVEENTASSPVYQASTKNETENDFHGKSESSANSVANSSSTKLISVILFAVCSLSFIIQ